MDNTVEDIRGALRRFAASDASTVLGTVTAVDADKCTCDVTDDGVIYFDVALQACPESSTGVLLVPRQGSAVLIMRIEDSDAMWAVVATTDIDKVVISIDKTKVEISHAGIMINDGRNGGLVNISNLTQWMMSAYTDLITIQGALAAISPVVIKTTPPDAALEDKLIKH